MKLKSRKHKILHLGTGNDKTLALNGELISWRHWEERAAWLIIKRCCWSDTAVQRQGRLWLLTCPSHHRPSPSDLLPATFFPPQRFCRHCRQAEPFHLLHIPLSVERGINLFAGLSPRDRSDRCLSLTALLSCASSPASAFRHLPCVPGLCLYPYP